MPARWQLTPRGTVKYALAFAQLVNCQRAGTGPIGQMVNCQRAASKEGLLDNLINISCSHHV